MQPNHFSDRFEAVRERFASSLESKVNDTRAELSCCLDAAFVALAGGRKRSEGLGRW